MDQSPFCDPALTVVLDSVEDERLAVDVGTGGVCVLSKGGTPGTPTVLPMSVKSAVLQSQNPHPVAQNATRMERPFDRSGFVVRYYKGSLMLDYVRQAMGNNQFYEAARDFFQTYKGRSIGTAEFRAFWRERLGDKKDALDKWLDSTGGLPEMRTAARN